MSSFARDRDGEALHPPAEDGVSQGSRNEVYAETRVDTEPAMQSVSPSEVTATARSVSPSLAKAGPPESPEHGWEGAGKSSTRSAETLEIFALPE